MPQDNEIVFYLSPFGYVPEWMITYVGKIIIENFGARIARIQSRPLPPQAYLAKQDSYDANYLLDDLKVRCHLEDWNIVGITTAKLYDKTDKIFLYGLALLGGPAVIAMLPSDSDKPSNEARTIIRNIILHELGHFFGLADRGCKRNCLMNDRTISTAVNLKYCATCEKRIQKILNGKAWQP